MSDPPDPDLPDLTALLLNDELRAALRYRAAISQAVGVIMARRRCSPREAFDGLRSAARHRDIELRDLCAQVIGGRADFGDFRDFGERPGGG